MSKSGHGTRTHYQNPVPLTRTLKPLPTKNHQPYRVHHFKTHHVSWDVSRVLWASPVAGVTEHLSVMLGDAAGVEKLPAVGAGEAELVIDLAQPLHLLGKVHILVTPGTHSGHSGDLSLILKKVKTIQIQGINQQFHNNKTSNWLSWLAKIFK